MAAPPPGSDDEHALVELAPVELTDVPRAAGGFGAIASTTGFLWRETGLRRGGKALLALNQPEGFDCPGCAWPEAPPAHRSRIEFCENGAKAVAEEATTRRAGPEVFAQHSVEELRGFSDHQLGQLGRITHPMVLRAGDRHYRPIAWAEAFATIAGELRAAGPAGSALYTSGRTSNEAAFLYQLVGRMFGTNNFPDCSNMCHESSGVGLKQTIGVGKGTVSLDDFEHADLILVIGQNPGTNHPRMLTTLREAARRGATIVSINPLREPGLARFSHPQKPLDLVRGGVALAAEVVQVRIGGDLAFLLGVGKALLEASGLLAGRERVEHLARDLVDADAVLLSLDARGVRLRGELCGEVLDGECGRDLRWQRVVARFGGFDEGKDRSEWHLVLLFWLLWLCGSASGGHRSMDGLRPLAASGRHPICAVTGSSSAATWSSAQSGGVTSYFQYPHGREVDVHAPISSTRSSRQASIASSSLANERPPCRPPRRSIRWSVDTRPAGGVRRRIL